MQKKLEEERKDNFDKAFHELLGNEGGYSNHPSDPGGETMWGVTKRVARAHGYKGRMKLLPLKKAKAIYRESYWDKHFDYMPYRVAFNVFDACVNHGLRTGIKLLQRAVGAVDDGFMGRETLFKVMLAEELEVVLLFNSARLSYYTKIRTWSSFGKGWTNRVAHNLKVK